MGEFGLLVFMVLVEEVDFGFDLVLVFKVLVGEFGWLLGGELLIECFLLLFFFVCVGFLFLLMIIFLEWLMVFDCIIIFVVL